MLKMYCFVLINFISILPSVLSIVDYCRNNTIQVNQHAFNDLRFAKENTEQEFTVVDKFKSLHCCTRGYRSIEWYKDGVSYPWSTDVSSFIVYPESGNQTIYSQEVSMMDSGRYWCLVRNDTHVLRHDVELTVAGSWSTVGVPKVTYRPRDQHVSIGGIARMYCEAFIGKIDLPDANSDVKWYKNGANGSLEENQRFIQKTVSREDKQIIGSYLIINGVRQDDLGLYRCRISNAVDQILELEASLQEEEPEIVEVQTHQISFFLLSAILFFIVLTCVSLVVIFFKFGLQVRLACKRFSRSTNEEDGKECDVLVVYNQKDTQFTLGMLVPTLHERYHYHCQCVSVSSDTSHWESMLSSKRSRCRRLLVVMTSSLVGGDWLGSSISKAVTALLPIHPKVICVFTKDLPYIDMKTGSGRELSDLLNKVHCVPYSERDIRQFWTFLRLGLPVRRKNNSQRHRHISRESLEGLV